MAGSVPTSQDYGRTYTQTTGVGLNQQDTQRLKDLRATIQNQPQHPDLKAIQKEINDLERKGGLPITNFTGKSQTPSTSTANTVWDTVKGVVSTVGNRVLNNLTNAYAQANKPYSGAATTPYLNAQADQLRQASGRMQGDAQRGYQIANRNERVQGDMDAAASAASQFSQGVAQTSGQAGAGAAALANMRTVDPSQYYAQHRQRADEQQAHAENIQRQAELANYNAIGNEALGAAQDQAYNDAQWYNSQAQALSNPGGQATQFNPFDIFSGNNTSTPTATPPYIPETITNTASAVNQTSPEQQTPVTTADTLDLDITGPNRDKLLQAVPKLQQKGAQLSIEDIQAINAELNKFNAKGANYMLVSTSRPRTVGNISDKRLKRIIKSTKKRFI